MFEYDKSIFDKLVIKEGDLFDEEWRNGYDTVILDIWVKDRKIFERAGDAEKREGEEILAVANRVKANIKGKVYVWGVRDRKLNPSVTIDLPKDYYTIISNYFNGIDNEWKDDENNR